MEQQWDDDLVEGKYIKDLEDNLSIIRLRFGDNSKHLFRNREFIVYERRETMDDGTLVLFCLIKFSQNQWIISKNSMGGNCWAGGSSGFIAKRDGGRIEPKARQELNKRASAAVRVGGGETWRWVMYGYLCCSFRSCWLVAEVLCQSSQYKTCYDHS